MVTRAATSFDPATIITHTSHFSLSIIPRVLHLLAPARYGGLESVVTMLAAVQGAESAHVAVVMSPDEAGDHPFLSGLKREGIAVTIVTVGRRNYLQEYRSLKALVADLRPTIIHTHGYHGDIIGGAVARARQVPVVSTVHGFVGGSLRNRVYERIQLIALRHADAVLAVSRPLVDRLVHAGVPSHKVHFVPNGFAPLALGLTRAVARRELGLTAGPPVAGWVGRLSYEKGADVMLDALAACSPQWRLSVIGDGNERERLRRRAVKLGIEDRVTWHGSLSNAGALMSAFDAFVLSSRTEGTPIALFEAMHTGVPIITTHVGGVPDVVSSAEAILVAPDQPMQIALALGSLLSEHAPAEQRAVRARKKVMRDFGTEEWVAAVSKIYRTVESRPGRAASRP